MISTSRFVKQILDAPRRAREPDIQDRRQADYLGRRIEVFEGNPFLHEGRVAQIADPPQAEFF
jgi:hypothetical protein